MNFHFIHVSCVDVGDKSRIVHWLSFYLERYFSNKEYGSGVQHLYITVNLTNGLHSYQELQDMYNPEYEPTFKYWSSDGEQVEGKNMFSFACLFTDEEYQEFCHTEEENRLSILVCSLEKSLVNFEKLPVVCDFDVDKFKEDFVKKINQKDFYFELANDEEIRRKFGEVNFYEIDRLQESKLTIDENTGLEAAIKILLNKNKYCDQEWLERGVNPSSKDVVDKMNVATNAFLVRLDHADVLSISNEETRLQTIMKIMDKIPWSDFESEERDFIFEEITPVLIKLEVEPALLIY